MNKNVLGFLGVVLLFFIIAATFVGYSVWKGNSDDRSSLAWVQTNIPPIVASWSLNELKQKASASYLHEIEFRGQLNNNFKRWAQLGTLQQLSDFKGQSDVTFPKLPSHKDPIFSASYTASARFSDGTASIHVALQQENGAWKLQAFNVTSADH